MKVKMGLKTLAKIGYAMYIKGYSKEELDGLSMFEVLMLSNDFDKWAIDNINEDN